MLNLMLNYVRTLRINRNIFPLTFSSGIKVYVKIDELSPKCPLTTVIVIVYLKFVSFS